MVGSLEVGVGGKDFTNAGLVVMLVGWVKCGVV